VLIKSEFVELKKHLGQQMTWTQAKAPQQTAVVDKVIFQSTKRENDQIVNAYGINGVSLQFDADDLPIKPEKFDSVLDLQGVKFIIDLVIIHRSRVDGSVVSYTCYCKGK